MVRVGVPKEIAPAETRVAAVPETIAKMAKSGLEILCQSGAGQASGYGDQSLETAGARIVADAQGIYSACDLVLKVARPSEAEVAQMREGQALIGFLQPLSTQPAQAALLRNIARQGVSAFAMELVPRTTRAQRMDALSTMSTVAGYKAALMGAANCTRFFPMLTTAVGTIPPAKVLVIGAGVAGLQAIATAKRLGAVVTAFDTRPVVAEQVKSVGGRFVSLEVSHEQAQDAAGYAKELPPEFYKQEQDLIRRHSKDADVIITTALIPGRRAPLLITEDMVREMKPGSVIVDLAAEQGGNCALTEQGQQTLKHGILIIGHLNIPGTMATHASLLYAKNLLALVEILAPGGKALSIDLNDDIVKGCLVTHQGHVVHPAVLAALG
jgi:proton-translocating NAD(P)+ transhydrogenase subunit alpha